MDADEDILSWLEFRVSRFYWLSHMKEPIDKVERKSFDLCEIYDFLANHLISLQGLKKKLVEGSSCMPDCGALCCHFSRDYSNQIPVTKGELAVLRRMLSKEGKKETDCYTMVPLQGIAENLRRYIGNNSDFVFEKNGVGMVCLLNPSNKVVDKELVRNTPKTVKKFRRMWVNQTSRACRFLSQDHKCMIYDRLRLTVCREFFCLTAITIIILRYLGLADEGILKLPMEDLNEISNNIAIAFRSKGLLGLEKVYDSKIREMAIGYAKGEETKEDYRKLKKFEREYDKKIRDCVKNVLKQG